MYLLKYAWNTSGRHNKKLFASEQESQLAGTSEWERLTPPYLLYLLDFEYFECKNINNINFK